jgi:hypothetical protein
VNGGGQWLRERENRKGKRKNLELASSGGIGRGALVDYL